MSTAMKVRITATFPLAGLMPDDVLKGAEANRAIAVAMHDLGYQDIEANVTVGTIRGKKAEPAPATPAKPDGKGAAQTAG